MTESEIYSDMKKALITIKQYGSYDEYLSSFNTDSLPHKSFKYRFFESLVKTNFKAAELNCVCSSVKPKDIPTLLSNGQVSFIGRERFMYVYKIENLKVEDENNESCN